MNIDIGALNNLINRQYRMLPGTSELEQLARLFSPGFLCDMVDLLNSGLSVKSGYQELLEISLCWIDKAPLADFSAQNITDHNGNVITKKVEIGDAVFIFSSELLLSQDRKTRSQSINTRALIFQAKRANNSLVPKVPIGIGKTADCSTAKELALLSNWPLFDLYKAPRSKTTLFTDMKLDPCWKKPSMSPYGWFGACPPGKFLEWKSRWMCGPAGLNQNCDITLGELLEALINKNVLGSSKTQSGVDFRLIDNWQSFSNKDSLNSWDVLINEILLQCSKSKTPKYLFRPQYPRVITRNTGTSDYKLCHLFTSDPLIPTRYQKIQPTRTTIAKYLFKENIKSNASIELLKNGAFPVLVFSLSKTEGTQD
jgi:hypothetical protein